MSEDSCVCVSVYKPSKSFIWNLKLLAELISKMLISSFLYS